MHEQRGNFPDTSCSSLTYKTLPNGSITSCCPFNIDSFPVMLARTSGRILARSSVSAGLSRPLVRLAVPCLTRNVSALRGFTSSTAALNTAETNPSASEEKMYRHFGRIEYMGKEDPQPSQLSLIEQITDEQIGRLPLIISSNGDQWKLAEPGMPLPFRNRPELAQEKLSPHEFANFVYSVFSFPSVDHLKRFNQEIGQVLQANYRVVQPVLLMDPRSRTLTVGLPSFIGLEPPFPAKANQDRIRDLLNQCRAPNTPQEQKKAIIRELRNYVKPYGFKYRGHVLSKWLFSAYEAIRQASPEQILTGFDLPQRPNNVEARGHIDGGSSASQSIAQKASRNWKTERSQPSGNRERRKRNESNRNNKLESQDKARSASAADAPRTKKSFAERLAKRVEVNNASLPADHPSLPEAGTFVAQDGDAHKPSQGDGGSLEEHVPFPKPSAEEMGIKKSDVWTSAPPKPSAEEMGFKKPDVWTSTPSKPEATAKEADDPNLPEAGTFVAQDGDAHKPGKRDDDALEEHVPFPKPSAEELGIKKPTDP